jgi:hypothetical protein
MTLRNIIELYKALFLSFAFGTLCLIAGAAFMFTAVVSAMPERVQHDLSHQVRSSLGIR